MASNCDMGDNERARRSGDADMSSNTLGTTFWAKFERDPLLGERILLIFARNMTHRLSCEWLLQISIIPYAKFAFRSTNKRIRLNDFQLSLSISANNNIQ